jgi:hypothetical protein
MNPLNLAGYLAKRRPFFAGSTVAASGKRVGLRHLLLSPLRFIKFYLLRGFLMVPGRHIGIGCFNSFIKYAKVMNMQRITQ